MQAEVSFGDQRTRGRPSSRSRSRVEISRSRACPTSASPNHKTSHKEGGRDQTEPSVRENTHYHWAGDDSKVVGIAQSLLWCLHLASLEPATDWYKNPDGTWNKDKDTLNKCLLRIEHGEGLEKAFKTLKALVSKDFQATVSKQRKALKPREALVYNGTMEPKGLPKALSNAEKVTWIMDNNVKNAEKLRQEKVYREESEAMIEALADKKKMEAEKRQTDHMNLQNQEKARQDALRRERERDRQEAASNRGLFNDASRVGKHPLRRLLETDSYDIPLSKPNPQDDDWAMARYCLWKLHLLRGKKELKETRQLNKHYASLSTALTVRWYENPEIERLRELCRMTIMDRELLLQCYNHRTDIKRKEQEIYKLYPDVNDISLPEALQMSKTNLFPSWVSELTIPALRSGPLPTRGRGQVQVPTGFDFGLFSNSQALLQKLFVLCKSIDTMGTSQQSEQTRKIRKSCVKPICLLTEAILKYRDNPMVAVDSLKNGKSLLPDNFDHYYSTYGDFEVLRYDGLFISEEDINQNGNLGRAMTSIPNPNRK